jgi:hypothetical protein
MKKIGLFVTGLFLSFHLFGIGAITGAVNICAGTTTTMSDTTAGGVWSSSNPLIATIGSTTGIVYGVSAGTVTITYTVGTVDTTATLIINPIPTLSSSLTPATVCSGSMFIYLPTSLLLGTTFSWNRNVVPGISNPPASGSGTISEILINSTSHPIVVTYVFTLDWSDCTNTQNVSVVINPLPNAGIISGAGTLCVDSSITLSDTITGGVWSASNSSASITSGGYVTGVAVGIDTIKYSVTALSCTTITRHIIDIQNCPTKVQQVNSAASYIYPNPNAGTFRLFLASPIEEDIKLAITNAIGQTVKEINISTNREIDFRLNVSQGIYFLSAASTFSRYNVKIFINK